VTNVTVAQRTDGSKIVDITYDLTEDAVFTEFDISVEVSFDDGATYTQISQITGDVGENIMPGTGKTITWNAGSEFDGTFGENVAVVIKATGHAVLSELPFEMVTVPAGEYTYGEGDTVLTIEYDFEIMKYEVTNAEFVLYLLDAFPEGNGPTPDPISWNGTTYIVAEGYGNHPVISVNWFQAVDFANHYGMRLPDEHEWEKAARGNTGYNYPWGNGITESYANYLESGDPWENGLESGTTPVGFYNGQNYEGFQTSDAPSPYGAYDMAGNMWEWTVSWNSEGHRRGCGGSWRSGSYSSLSWHANGFDPYDNLHYVGFRLVRTIN
jgi:formylglycine-generating enzyme required for sulfatase activity